MTNKDKIQSIQLKYFRGATKPLQIDFETKKPMVMIFGENGTGKSTIIDAIDFVFNSQCGSLKEKSSTNIKSHLPAIGSNPREVEVSIQSQKGLNWKGKLSGSKPAITNSDKLLSVRILRRDKILKLINAEPKKRYEALRDFIELPVIRSSEVSLRECIRFIEQELNQNVYSREDKKSTLKEIWETEKEAEKGQSEIDFMKWAKGVSQTKDQELSKKIIQYEQSIEWIKKPLEYFEELKDLKIEWEEKKQKLNSSKGRLKTLSRQNQPEEIIDILQKTFKFLQKKETTEECPACEQPIVPKNLQKRISERLKNMQDFVLAKNQHEQDSRAFEFAQKSLSTKEKELQESSKTLIEYSTKAESLDELKKLEISFNENNFLAEGTVNLEKAKVFFKYAESIMQEAYHVYQKDQKTLNQLNLIKSLYLNLKQTKDIITELDRKKEYLSQILKIVEDERKAYIENLLSEISSSIEALYIKLHPQEGLDNIQLSLNPKRQASLEMTSNFQNKEAVPPQAYFSESHLDTLGICVFIAMAKHSKDDIIVLDDVVTSLDQQHLNRFIQMLDEENKNFSQIILTTHYRPWRDRYKFHRQSSSNVCFIELSPFWSLVEGIKSHQTKLSISELEELKLKGPFDRQSVSSKAGVFLESLLDSLAIIYELRLPRREDPKYTLGELMSGFSKKFIDRMKIKNESGEVSLSDIMNKLFQIAEPIRNQVGSHFSTLGMNISDKEVMSFLDQTIALAKVLICPFCKGLPQKKTSLLLGWKCSCKKTILQPLSK